MIKNKIIDNCMLMLSKGGKRKALEKRDQLNVSRYRAKTQEEKYIIDKERHNLTYAMHLYNYLIEYDIASLTRNEIEIYYIFWKTQYEMETTNDY